MQDDNEKATVFIFGTEFSIVDNTFDRNAGCIIDKNQSQECVGISDNVYTAVGRINLKNHVEQIAGILYRRLGRRPSGPEAILGWIIWSLRG